MDEFTKELGDRKSQFNEAAFKMIRIHKLQHIINLCSMNKLGEFTGDVETGVLFSGRKNYEVIFDCINQLYKEVSPKLREAEKVKAKEYKKELKEYLTNPELKIYKKYFNESTKKVADVLDIKNWRDYEEKMDDYEELIRKLVDKKGFAGKEQEDPTLAALE